MSRRMAISVAVTLVVLLAEVVGGFAAGSLALLSDAGHVFSDLLALMLSWYGVRQIQRPSNAQMTFGYHRVGIFVALFNAALLVGVSLAVMAEAYRRLLDPQPVEGGLTLGVAVVGLAVNLFVLFTLQGHGHNLAVRSALLHVMGDVLGSVAVIAAGAVILLTGWYWTDPIASVVISGIITIGSFRIAREAMNVLLESTPRGVDIAEVVRAMYGVTGVRDVHDLHIWSISPEIRALSTHVTVDDTSVSGASAVLADMNRMLLNRFGIRHSTIQLEVEGFDTADLYCSVETADSTHAAHAH